MKYQSATERLIRSYEGAVAWGENTDRQAAMQEAVKAAFPGIPEDHQAELYTRIEEKWEEYKDGFVPRKVWIGQVVRDYMSEVAAKAFADVTVSTHG